MRSAFTLIELIITVGLIAALLSFSSLNLLSLQHKTSLTQQVQLIASDLRTQQLDSMIGNNHGIYFANNAYILFTGNTYDPSDPANFSTNLPSTLNFTNTTLPSSQIVFQKGSGEIANFSNSTNTFTLIDSTQGESKEFTLNALGVIYQIQ